MYKKQNQNSEMTTAQLKEKIKELETWLIKNPDSTERALIVSDLKKMITILSKNNE
ncbi:MULTISPECIES: hypothetical protein [unclassified Flavobacterium]|jgi:hypothetical protein|uniref:hypothetical protein n=1 Tax=unclassified Flavobacterium TaxID=196869 RepID=UPI00131A6B71|nr:MULTISPECIES: hypothetical protein [unclassified Flavobacterium]